MRHHPFHCDRTCPMFEHIDHCRFNPLFIALGSLEEVYSETASVAVQFEDLETLATVVKAMGGQVLGHGTHQLWGKNEETGYGFKLPGWVCNLVVRDGELFFDSMLGTWAAKGDINKLTFGYAKEVAKQAAERLGWESEETETGLRTYHAEGGYLDIKIGSSIDTNADHAQDDAEPTSANVQVQVEAFHFKGDSCHRPVEQLSMELGNVLKTTQRAQSVRRAATG